MRKTSLALAVAASTLGMSQVAFADFIGDSKASLTMRNFYFDQNTVNTTNNNGEASEWGQGFILNYQSGFTEGTVGFGVDAVGMLGVRLDGGGRNTKAGRDRTPGQLFPLESDGSAVDDFSKAGATAKVRISKTEGRVGTLMPKLPILVSNDGRLLPQMFEGGMITSNEIDNLTLTAGQIEHAVSRASSNSTGLSVAGGSEASNKFYFAGGDWKVNSDLTAQYYYANLEDYYKQHFAGLGHNLALGEGSLKTDLRYFRTSSDGKNGKEAGYSVGGYTRNGDGEIDNNTWSAAFTYSLGSHAVMLGHQRVSEDSNFVQLNQGGIEGSSGASVYLLTDRLVTSFTRAGERTTFGQYSYDFATLGVPGLKASVAYLKGTNIKVAGGNDAKEWERDIALDYAFQDGALKGLGLGWRYGVLRGNAPGQADTDQNRLIVSYTLPLM
ncbi:MULTISPECIES: OprD family porin [Pseudomonadaceae]|uniref:OprD family porin n=1 Tax=Ectopseudomonas toyotomiensis TaxID=554344 RepID=A0AA42IS80_9GAMM|nr:MULTISPECIES: OprD family porin [Pseudomonas]AQZ31886.1 porin [Pseudomonas sp. LPH1]MBG0842602.1 OprD family porin [Pseudomonas toyotomiensis]MDH0704600.1 OprD family porin [Pseudomonas toyotomiensis]QSL94381.1 OprD family porin [Pseudomonas toyotomiensis]